MAISKINPNSLGGVPAFSGYITNGSANQSVTASTWTKVKIDTKSFDTNNNFDNTTNYRFTPTVAGYYQFNGCLSFNGTSMSGCVLAVVKNSTLYLAQSQVFAPFTNATILSASGVIYMNGTTDYVELFGYNASASAAVFLYGVTSTFSGALVRAA